MTQSTPPKPSPANPPASPDVTMQTLSTGQSRNALDRLPFDPAWIAIGVAGVVLIGASLSVMRGDAPDATVVAETRQGTPAVGCLWGGVATPDPPPTPAAPPPEITELRTRLEAAEAEARAAAERLASVQQSLARSAAAAEVQAREAAQRLAAMQQSLAQSEAGAQALAQRIAPLAERVEAAEASTARLVLVETLRSRLDAGQSLGPVLSRLPGEAPPALARFADTAPPTEPALRLAFEEVVRTARARVAETQPRGIGSLFTIRRGDEVIWGDANEAMLERARRALTAGDLSGALGHLGELPDSHRAPMAEWIGQAQSLVAARAVLRDLAGG